MCVFCVGERERLSSKPSSPGEGAWSQQPRLHIQLEISDTQTHTHTHTHTQTHTHSFAERNIECLHPLCLFLSLLSSAPRFPLTPSGSHCQSLDLSSAILPLLPLLSSASSASSAS